jgi:2-dehydro-3-deoxyphosphooctonate aldolase (KDO 8-P synthase)
MCLQLLIYTNEDAAMAAQYVDVLQILSSPSDRFSCGCCQYQRSKKKGQFMSPESMKHVVKSMIVIMKRYDH